MEPFLFCNDLIVHRLQQEAMQVEIHVHRNAWWCENLQDCKIRQDNAASCKELRNLVERAR